jgi:hypothetical protein
MWEKISTIKKYKLSGLLFKLVVYRPSNWDKESSKRLFMFKGR